jgi:hypothetical protein
MVKVIKKKKDEEIPPTPQRKRSIGKKKFPLLLKEGWPQQTYG